MQRDRAADQHRAPEPGVAVRREGVQRSGVGAAVAHPLAVPLVDVRDAAVRGQQAEAATKTPAITVVRPPASIPGMISAKTLAASVIPAASPSAAS